MKYSFASLLLCVAVACGGPGTTGSKLDQAVAVARDLRARPGEPEKVLAEHQLSAEQWEALMFEIADDPALAGQYEAALRE